MDHDSEIFAALRAPLPYVAGEDSVLEAYRVALGSGALSDLDYHLGRMTENAVKQKIRPDVLIVLAAAAPVLLRWLNEGTGLHTFSAKGFHRLSAAEIAGRLRGGINHFTRAAERMMIETFLASLFQSASEDREAGAASVRIHNEVMEAFGFELGKWFDDELQPGLSVVSGYAQVAYRKQISPTRARIKLNLRNIVPKLREWATLSVGAFTAARYVAMGVNLANLFTGVDESLPVNEETPWDERQFVLAGQGTEDEVPAFSPMAAEDLRTHGPEVVRMESVVRTNCPALRIDCGGPEKYSLVTVVAPWMAKIFDMFWDEILPD